MLLSLLLIIVEISRDKRSVRNQEQTPSTYFLYGSYCLHSVFILNSVLVSFVFLSHLPILSKLTNLLACSFYGIPCKFFLFFRNPCDNPIFIPDFANDVSFLFLGNLAKGLLILLIF
jgi:hypothetical protein